MPFKLDLCDCGSDIGGVNTTVARLSADLRDAQYDLDQTTVIAPTDSHVTQLFLQPGLFLRPLFRGGSMP